MDAEKVNSFIAAIQNKIPAESIESIKQSLMDADESKLAALEAVQLKDPTTAEILAIFLGGFGAEYFYLGKIGLGIGKLLLTCCCFVGVVWCWINWFTTIGATKKANYQALQMAL